MIPVAVFVVVHHSAINAPTLVTRVRLKWRTSSMAGRAYTGCHAICAELHLSGKQIVTVADLKNEPLTSLASTLLSEQIAPVA
jgi:hypothetical protein